MTSKPFKSDTKHAYYPLFLDITGKMCLVLGGGEVASRKVATLLDFGASVTVVSPAISSEISALGRKRKIIIKQRQYETEDLDNAVLVFACTDNSAINDQVRRDASLRQVPVNVVDDPERCDFIVPSVVRKGALTIAISTSGELPLLSKKIREKVEEIITDDYLQYLQIVGRFRKHLLAAVKDGKKRRLIMKKIGEMDTREVLSQGLPKIKKLIQEEKP